MERRQGWMSPAVPVIIPATAPFNRNEPFDSGHHAPRLAPTFLCGARLQIVANSEPADSQCGANNRAKNDNHRRPGRTLWSWSVNRLAIAASVSDSDIDDLELERRRQLPKRFSEPSRMSV
jgi:hypothetical protein